MVLTYVKLNRTFRNLVAKVSFGNSMGPHDRSRHVARAPLRQHDMVFTLHRYVFRELIRVFWLATVALTVILSLGLILQPIQKYGIGPEQVPHLLTFFVPITLTYVLPMAALFAATLVYGRLAGDNELMACKASGVSPLTLIGPGCLLGLLVAIANLALSFHVMPYFFHRAEYAIKADAKQILFRNIQRRGFFLDPDGDYAIYADHAQPQQGLLRGVIVLEMSGGSVDTLIAAEAARVSFGGTGRSNAVQIAAAAVIEMKDDSALRMGNTSFNAPFGSILNDEIAFKRLDEMKGIRDNLLIFHPVEKEAKITCAQFATELLARDIQQALDQNRFFELTGEATSIRLKADQCLLGSRREIQLIGHVDVTERDETTGRAGERLVWEKASLYLEHLEGDPLAFTITLDLHNANAANTPNIIGRNVVQDLRLPESIRRLLFSGDLLEMLQPDFIEAQLGDRMSEDLETLSSFLKFVMALTLVQIDAEIHSRLVFGLGCIPMILIGIGLGILLRGGHMLTAFGSSCLPAAILILCAVSGRHVAENPDATTAAGFSIMWAGLASLWIMALVIFRRVYRG